MSAFRLPLSAALALALVGLLPAAARAQLKDAQDKGWSVLKDGYALVVSMKDNKSNRTRANFETALSKIMTSMADMSSYIDKMGDKVADEDKSYAAGLKDNIKNAWKGVADAREKTARAFDAAKDSPEKLAEISDELDKLKSSLEQYETACKAAYLNYKARWDDIKSALDKANDNLKSVRDKIKSLDDQDESLTRDESSVSAEMDKIWEQNRKISEAVDKLHVQKLEIQKNMEQAFKDGKADDYKRYAAELDKMPPLYHQIILKRIEVMEKLDTLDDKMIRIAKDKDKVAKDTESALEAMGKVEPLKLLQRFSLWDTEFPARSYSFQTLR
jgi:DNA repair exonuclease SbcCD ATPase subunit